MGFCRASGLPTEAMQVLLYFLRQGGGDLSQPLPVPPTPNHGFPFAVTEEAGLHWVTKQVPSNAYKAMPT